MRIVWSPRAVRHLIEVRNFIASDSEASAAEVVQRNSTRSGTFDVSSGDRAAKADSRNAIASRTTNALSDPVSDSKWACGVDCGFS